MLNFDKSTVYKDEKTYIKLLVRNVLSFIDELRK